MNRLIFAVAILGTATAVVAETGPKLKLDYSSSLPAAPAAQSETTTTTSNTTTTTSTANTNSDWKQEQPIFTLPVGGSYTIVDVNNVGGGISTTLWGWYMAPTLQVTRYLAARVDVQQDYDTNLHLQEARLLRLTTGPQFTYPIPLISKWATPFVYAEGGATRISYPYDPSNNHPVYIQWEATALAGLGFQVPITHRIGFQVIPAEYSTFQLDNNNWIGNFSAKAGFVFNFYGSR